MKITHCLSERDKSWHLSITLVICLAASLYFLSFYAYGINEWDEGVPLSGAVRIDRGEHVGRDFNGYAPLRYYIYLWSLRWANWSIHGPRIALAIFSGVIAALIYRAGIPMLGASYAALPAAFYMLTPGPYYYRFLTAGILLMLAAVRLIFFHSSPAAHLGAGFLAAITIWLREESGLLVSVIILLHFLWILFRSRPFSRSLLRSGALLSVLLAWFGKIMYLGGWASAIGYYRDAWTVAVANRTEMSLPWPPVWRLSHWESCGVFALHDFLIWMTFFMIAAAVLIVWPDGRRNRETQLFFIIMVYSLQLVIWRTGFGNLLRILPFTVIFIAHACFKSAAKPVRLPGKMFQVLGAVLALIMIVDSLMVSPEVYGSIGMRWKLRQTINLPRLAVKADRSRAGLITNIHRIVDSALDDNGTLFTAPVHGIWNFSTNHINPTPYEWLMPGTIPKLQRARLAEEFVHDAPDVILINDVPIDGRFDRKFSRVYPDLERWVRHSYYPWIQLGSYTVWIRLSGAQVQVFEADILKRVQWSEGQNVFTRVPSSWEDSAPALTQLGDTALALNVTLPERAWLKTRIVTGDPPMDHVNAVTVYLVRDDEPMIPHSIQITPQMMSDPDGYVYLDLEAVGPGNASIVLSSSSDASPGVTWLEPVVFSWRRIPGFIDTMSLRD